jgi:hypothetical protein
MTLNCTLTGVDAWTSLGEIMALSREFPFVEWGFLLYEGRNEGRYSAPPKLALQLEHVSREVRTALHICGPTSVSQYLKGEGFAADLAKMVGRVQINLCLSEGNVGQLGERITWSNRPVIIQHNRGNARLWGKLPGSQYTLFDGSGGKGVLPETWPAPISGQPFGYAGGLSPENILTELPRMAEASQGGAAWQWIDMEGRLRVEDRFSLPLCRRVLESVARWNNGGKA